MSSVVASVRVFISYSTADRDLITPLKEALAQAGAAVWLDHEQLVPGTSSYQVAIRQGIAQASAVIYSASETAAVSSAVYDEISIARSQGKRVIPFWIRGQAWHDCAPIGWGTTQYIDGRGANFQSGLDELLRTLGLNKPIQRSVHTFPEMPYSRALSRQYPGLFVILLDQSDSMAEEAGGRGTTKSRYAARAVNDLIYGIAQRAGPDYMTGVAKRSAYISVLGYAEKVYPLLGPTSDPIALDSLDQNPRGVERVEVDVYDVMLADYRKVEMSRPYWIDKDVARGRKNMASAVNEARKVVERWLDAPPERGQAKHIDCFPPVIINITDGEKHHGDDPVLAAEAIRNVFTMQGACLFLTLQIGREDMTTIVFPGAEDEVARVNPMAGALFRMCSAVPDRLREATKLALMRTGSVMDIGQQHLGSGARAFIYGAQAELLVGWLSSIFPDDLLIEE